MILQQKYTLKLCSITEVNSCTFHLGKPHYDQFHTLEQFDEFSKRSLEELMAEAEKLGITLNIENVWYQPSLVDNYSEIDLYLSALLFSAFIFIRYMSIFWIQSGKRRNIPLFAKL